MLYAEIMPYNIICFKSLLSTQANLKIHVVCWGADKKLTPYQVPEIPRVSYYLKNDFNAEKIRQLINELEPSCLYVAGRMEKDYLKACKHARGKKILVIGTSDGQYKGGIKQLIQKLFSFYLFKRYFNYLMVPGIYQYEYARFLGFSREQILFPQYCADVSLFNNYYHNRPDSKLPKKNILFVGRLNKIKGINFLIEAFLELVENEKFDLNLVLVGNGAEKKNIPVHPRIIQHDFLDQVSIIGLLNEVRFFCLPSIKEPWGVVLHEFTAAGMPIVTTDVCGAATAFVKHYYNGLIIKPAEKNSLKNAMQFMASLNEEKLEEMETRSYELSKQITPAMWSGTILSVISKQI